MKLIDPDSVVANYDRLIDCDCSHKDIHHLQALSGAIEGNYTCIYCNCTKETIQEDLAKRPYP